MSTYVYIQIYQDMSTYIYIHIYIYIYIYVLVRFERSYEDCPALFAPGVHQGSHLWIRRDGQHPLLLGKGCCSTTEQIQYRYIIYREFRYMYIYDFIYISINKYIYICMYVCMYVYLYMYMYMYTSSTARPMLLRLETVVKVQ